MKYINIIKNIIKFKTGYYLEFLMPETMKLLGGNKSKVTKDKNNENVPILEITKIALVHSCIVKKIINKTQESCIHLFLINSLVNY